MTSCQGQCPTCVVTVFVGDKDRGQVRNATALGRQARFQLAKTKSAVDEQLTALRVATGIHQSGVSAAAASQATKLHVRLRCNRLALLEFFQQQLDDALAGFTCFGRAFVVLYGHDAR